ncbi:MAG: hypothetical protein AAFQ82_15965, partial [Myxococcota bacterium]
MYDDPEALLDTRGGGVVVVDDRPDRARSWIEPLRSLRVDVELCPSLEAAGELLEGACPPRALIARHMVGDVLTESWCQRVRSDVQLTATSILVILEEGSDRGLWADGYLRAPFDVDDLKHAVRSMLRGYAVRRNISRRERRRAIRWLSGVVSHELNNPLAAALANIDDAIELMEGAADRHPDVAEAAELTREALRYLDRIRDAEKRLRDQRAVPRGDPERFTIEELVSRLRRELGDNAIRFRARSDSSRQAIIDPVLLCATASAVYAAARGHCGGSTEVTIAIDGGRVSVLLELLDAPAFDPEALLTPRLVTDGSGPLAYDPGLSSLESSFGEAGGQIFATPMPNGW